MARRWKEIVSLGDVVHHAGVVPGMPSRKRPTRLSGEKGILLNGRVVELDTHLKPDDIVSVGGAEYRVIPGGPGRLQLQGALPKEPVEGPVRVHCGLHKCMTIFTKNVYQRSCKLDRRLRRPRRARPLRFRHFYHRLDTFLNECHQYAITSLSGHALDLDRFDDIRVVRFIRDPRDLVISGYFYHKRGGEHWCRLTDPQDVDWRVVNASVPVAIPAGSSLMEYLQSVSVEEGLAAEFELRRPHLESMRGWPEKDDRVRLFRYEDVLGHEVRTFAEIFDFFGMPLIARLAARRSAARYRAGRTEAKAGHIRDPEHGQWRKHFTPALRRTFNEQYGDLLERHGYPLD